MSLKPIQILINAKDNASSVLSGLQTKVAAVAIAVAGYFGVKMFSGAVDSAEALDAQMRKLEAVIQATGGAAGLTAKEIDEMASRLDEATLGSEEGFRDAAAQLLTFKSVGKDVFETTLLLAQDLADAGFGNLSTNVVQLGKALEDPVKGMGALAESGVTFTKDQQSVIKVLMETGRAAEAQGVILKAVAGQVGGTAVAMGGGLSGAVDLVNKRFKDLQEQLGAAVLPVFKRFNELVAETYKRLTDDGTVGRFGEAIAKGFQAALDWARAFLAEVDFNALAGKAASAADQVGEAFTRLGEWATNAGNSVKLAYGVMSGGTNVVLAGIYKIGEAFAGVASNITYIAGKLSIAWSKIGFGDAAKRMREEGEKLIEMSGGLWSASEALAEKAREALDAAGDAALVAQDGFSGLTAEVERAAKAAAGAVGAIDDVTEKTLAAVRATDAAAFAQQKKAQADEAAAAAIKQMRDEYRELIASGDLQAAALRIEEINKALRGTPSAADGAEKAALDVAVAFKAMGIQTEADLKKAAEEAKKNFGIIKTSGQATAEGLQTAFKKYYEAAVAANGGTATEALKAEAAMNGLDVSADRAGKTISRSMRDGSRAVGGLTESINDASDAAEEYVGWADRMADRNSKVGKLPPAGRTANNGEELGEGVTEVGSGGQYKNRSGFASDAKGNTLGAATDLGTLTGIANFAQSAGLALDQARKLALEFSDGKGNIPYFSNPGQMKYGGETLSAALLKAVERTTFGTGQAGAATVGRRVTHDIRINDDAYPVTLDDDDRESSNNLEAIIARLTRDKRRAA